MTIEGKGKYLGKRKVELDKEINLPPDTEILFIIEDIRPAKKSKPLKGCFSDLVYEDLDLEKEIKNTRKEIQENLDKKFENWNT